MVIDKTYGSRNNGGATATVFCPIPQAAANDILGAEYTAYDNSASANITCTLRIMSLSGATVYVSYTASTSIGSGNQTVTLKPNDGTGVNASGRAVSLECTIPAKVGASLSSIASYRVLIKESAFENPTTAKEAWVGHGTTAEPNRASRANVDYFGQWGVHNISTTDAARVFLPVILRRDVIQTHGSGELTMTVYDRHPTLDVVCKLKYFDVNNGSLIAEISSQTSGSSPSPMTLNFVEPMCGFPASGNTVVFQCDIPPQSAGSFSHVTAYKLCQRTLCDFNGGGC